MIDVLPWYAFAVTMIPVPPDAAAAIRTARSFASLPLHESTTLAREAGKVAFKASR
jgi:hypothetical protein